MKTQFDLLTLKGRQTTHLMVASIIGTEPDNKPYVKFWSRANDYQDAVVQDQDLERFAVNILKAMKSKRLKP